MIPTGRIAVPLGAAGAWLELLFYGTCLAVALLAAALVIELVRRWLRKGEQTLSASDQLAHYRTLYKRGEISQEEFDRLRAVLGGELRPGAKACAAPAARSEAGQQSARRPPTASGPNDPAKVLADLSAAP